MARKESLTATQIFRAGNFLSDPRGNPRKQGPGGKRSYGHEVPVGRVPRGRFGHFAAMGKVTRRLEPGSRKTANLSLAAESQRAQKALPRT